jgi:hypothetical protein
MVRGSCLCRGVAWEYAGDPIQMLHCHCSMCRKAHGSAFATWLSVPGDGFRWLRGQELVRQYESSPGFLRSFCSRCGSAVAVPGGERAFMPAGCLDDDPGMRPQAHIFVASMAPWHEIADALPRFDAFPTGSRGAVQFRTPEPPEREGAVRGSCLCGGVSFEIEGELSLMINCHCSRCRKARSAAHATNLFAPAAGFRWIRGEELIDAFKVPDSQRFTHGFCRVCGSSVPRGGAEMVGVPAGTLDGDPGARERLHIFCGSKAPWYEIADDLPQHEEAPSRRA